MTQPIPELKQPALWQNVSSIINHLEYLKGCAKEHSDLCLSKAAGHNKEILFIYHPEAIKQIFNDYKSFSAPKFEILEPLLGSSSLISLEEDKHKQEKKMFMPTFHKSNIQNYGKLINEITEQVFSEFKMNEILIADKVIHKISLKIIIKIVLGIDDIELSQEISQAIQSLLIFFNKPINVSFFIFSCLRNDLGTWNPWNQFIGLQQELDQLLCKQINRLRNQNNSEYNSILSLLLFMKDEHNREMTDRRLIDEVKTMLLAGHETTTNAITWALYWIHYYPKIKNKLLLELENLPEKDNSMAIFNLPYLTAVCHESLRIYPSVVHTFSRVVKKQIKLLNYQLKPNTKLHICIYLTHHREDLYPNHEKFIPERFLERQYTPYEFIPFGGGTRRCLGETFALYEMKLIIARIIKNYQLILKDNKKILPYRKGVLCCPKGGVKMIFKGQRLA